MKSKFTWIFTLLLAFFIQFSFAQEKTITGVVTDPSGMPIPGVNVMVEGSQQGIQTDFDGRYSINASVGQKLVFSFVGMQTQTVRVGASNTVSVQMSDDAKLLEEVVVQGYRNATRATSNVAVTTISSKTIEGRPNASFIQTLQGQIPGLNISSGSGMPGANSTVILRGYGSVNGNVEPLYVIDGVPLNSDNFRSINPNDIESVSVLKDAGATAVYGSRGANGVIVVKTKRGNFEAPLSIKYTGVTSYTTIQDNSYNKMNSRQLLRLEKRMGRGRGATLTDSEINSYPIDTDWYDVIFRTGASQNHVLSLTSGGKNLSSFTSLGYFDQEGIIARTDLKRFNFRNNMNGKSDNGRFNYNTSLTINFSRRNEVNNLGTADININPVVAANGAAPYISPSEYVNGRQVFDLYSGDGTLLYTPLMLMDILRTGINRTDELKMIANMQANYRIVDGLTLGTSFGADYTQATGLRVQDPESFNSYVFQQPGENYLGFQSESFAREFHFNMNMSLNYNKTFADKHTIDASIFTEYYKAHLKSFNGVQNGLDPKFFEPGNGDGFIAHNPFPTGDGSPAFYVPSYGSNKAEAGLFSYFTIVDYDYDQKYGVGFSFRRDASYRFAESNRWGTFWSVSGRWNIDKEAFMQGSMFQMLKLRASYGTTGNQNISGQSIFANPNASRTLYASTPGYGNEPSYALSQLGNPDLKWETVEQANIGVDFELLTRRLRGTFDVYQRTTKDLYLPSQFSGVTGTYGIDANNGDLQNRGVEALLSYDVVSNKDWRVTLNFNGSYNKSEVKNIPEEIDNTTTSFHNGGMYSEFYLVRYAGVNPANGNMLFYDASGNLTEDPDQDNDRVYTGKSPVPTYQGGFGFEANYKGFFLTTQFSFVADIYRLDYDLSSLSDPGSVGQFNVTSDLQNAWTPSNRVTNVPSLNMTNIGEDSGSDRWLRDASYVRLRYTSLGYNFSKELLDRTPFTNLRAYLQAENLLTWTKWRGWDAESNRGADQNQYPTPRIISVGLEVEF